MSLNFNFEVVEGIKTNLRNAGKRKREAGIRATRRAAERLLELSKPLVPKDTETLVNSGKVVQGKGIAEFNVVYSATVEDRYNAIGKNLDNVANPDFNYAWIQHEATWFNHPNGGQAKYLEQPFKENQKRFLGTIASAIRRTKS